jgi:hypothetical protein
LIIPFKFIIDLFGGEENIITKPTMGRWVHANGIHANGISLLILLNMTSKLLGGAGRGGT